MALLEGVGALEAGRTMAGGAPPAAGLPAIVLPGGPGCRRCFGPVPAGTRRPTGCAEQTQLIG